MTKSFSALLLILGAFCGCSGGGGGGDEFAGVWSGSVTLVEDSCGFAAPDSYLYFTHLVNQTESEVALDNGFETFSGEPTGSGSFSVSATRDIVNPLTGQTCSGVITWRYDAVEKDYAGFVVRSTDVTCETGKCKISFSGSGYRSTNSVNPVPVVSEDNSSEGGLLF